MLQLVMELRWLLAGAGALGLITGFAAKRVSKVR